MWNARRRKPRARAVTLASRSSDYQNRNLPHGQHYALVHPVWYLSRFSMSILYYRIENVHQDPTSDSTHHSYTGSLRNRVRAHMHIIVFIN